MFKAEKSIPDVDNNIIHTCKLLPSFLLDKCDLWMVVTMIREHNRCEQLI